MSDVLFLKLLHIIGAFLWMGAMINLCRLLAAIAQDQRGAATEHLVDLARATYNKGSIPGMLLTLLGGGLFYAQYQPPGGWMHAKLLLVLLLVIADQLLRAKMSSAAKPGAASASAAYFRAMELATLLGLVAVLSLAILRPF